MRHPRIIMRTDLLVSPLGAKNDELLYAVYVGRRRVWARTCYLDTPYERRAAFAREQEREAFRIHDEGHDSERAMKRLATQDRP